MYKPPLSQSYLPNATHNMSASIFGSPYLMSDLTPKSPLDFRHLIWTPELHRMSVPGSWFRISEEYDAMKKKSEDAKKQERLREIEQELAKVREEHESDHPRKNLWRINAALVEEQRTLSAALGLPAPTVIPLPRIPLREVVVHTGVKKARLAAQPASQKKEKKQSVNRFSAFAEDDSDFESAV